MKRFSRKTLALVAGLAIGWYLAGVVSPHLPFVHVSYAEDSHGNMKSKQHKSEHGPYDKAAKLLVPARHDATWFKPVLWSTIALFAAGLTLGSLALTLRGPEPPNAASAHGHDADDH